MRIALTLPVILLLVLFGSCRSYNKINLLPSDIQSNTKTERQIERKTVYIKSEERIFQIKNVKFEGDSVVCKEINIVESLPTIPTVEKHRKKTKEAIITLKENHNIETKIPNELTFHSKEISNVAILKPEKISGLAILFISIGSTIALFFGLMILLIFTGNFEIFG